MIALQNRIFFWFLCSETESYTWTFHRSILTSAKVQI